MCFCGINRKSVFRADTIGKTKSGLGASVAIAGGGLTGVDCAIELVQAGKQVVVVDMLPLELWAGADLMASSRLEEIKSRGGKLLPSTKIIEITDKGLLVETTNGLKENIAADSVVTAFGIAPDTRLIESLCAVIPDTYLIGDCNKTGDVFDAIHSAFYRAAIV